ncbi:hypothetical protein ACIA5H_36560 [Nocardia sp. NPDC051900]|uniref:hypothetical protein n=1 Tax=Nocardia sp. NPDC051900 TaxID=3364326 RepID=UPI0037B63550
MIFNAQQDAVWRRTKAGNELRSLLREYYPAFLDVFAGKSATNLANSRPAPSCPSPPLQPTSPNSPKPGSRLRCAEPDATAASTRSPPRSTKAYGAPTAPTGLVETAFGRQAMALLAALDTACDSTDDLEHGRCRGIPQARRPRHHHHAWHRIHDALWDRARVRAGLAPQPTAAVIDSQTVHGCDTVAAATVGYDAGKEIKGP